MVIIETHNHGPLILSSTYWGSDYERAGKIYCSVNAGAIRLLIPRHNRHLIQQWRAAEYAILSRGPWREEGRDDAVEILWEDHTESPYVLHLSAESFDLLPGRPPPDQDWLISAWDLKKRRPHKALERRCYWRRVTRLPCLEKWREPTVEKGKEQCDD